VSSLPDPDAPDFRVPTSPASLVLMAELESLCAVDLLPFLDYLSGAEAAERLGTDLQAALLGWTHRRLVELGARRIAPEHGSDLP
jgi:hypothetical protein